MLKRFFSIFTISLILTGSFFSIYSFDYPVYADSTTDEWMSVTTNEQLVEAFRYYCKSRDLTIEGSVADGVTSFTTKTFNSLCNTLGIDVTALQAHLKYSTDSNTGLRYLFDNTGITAYNRIFAQFLQDNDLQVGDTNVDKTLYSGMVYTDNDGVNSLVTFYDGDNGNTITAMGNAYHGYDGWYALNDAVYPSNVQYPTYTFSGFNFNYVDNNTHTFYVQKRAVSEGVYRYRGVIDYLSASYFWMYNGGNTGMFSVLYNIRDNKYYIGSVDLTTNKIVGTKLQITPNNGQSQNVSIIIVAPLINNNTYEGDTIINNNGDTNNYPDTDPNPNPTPDPPTIPDNTGWQDFSLPEMPNDWLIYGMEKKFPFDIPFNIMFALSLLNHEPEIPKFEGDIDLKVCTWHYDIDLTPFDDLAKILRKFEVLAFIIGLAILTKNLINWG